MTTPTTAIKVCDIIEGCSNFGEYAKRKLAAHRDEFITESILTNTHHWYCRLSAKLPRNKGYARLTEESIRETFYDRGSAIILKRTHASSFYSWCSGTLWNFFWYIDVDCDTALHDVLKVINHKYSDLWDEYWMNSRDLETFRALRDRFGDSHEVQVEVVKYGLYGRLIAVWNTNMELDE